MKDTKANSISTDTRSIAGSGIDPKQLQKLAPTILEDYSEFVAEKNNWSSDKAQKVINQGWNAFGKNGWYGPEFRDFCEFNQEVFQYKYDDSPEQVYDFYKFHERTDFFRMLSALRYSNSNDASVYNKLAEIILSQTKDKPEITIVDYGYGLATNTIFLTHLIKLNVNKRFKLVLVDVERPLAEEFILWMGKRYNIRIQFIKVTKENPHPKLPKFNFIQVKDSFEHIYHPEVIVDNINESMEKGGIAYVTYDDERKELSHVTCDLQIVRDKFKELNFVEVGKGLDQRGVMLAKRDDVSKMVSISDDILTHRMSYVPSDELTNVDKNKIRQTFESVAPQLEK
jgi:hypothetical protein